MKDIKKIIADKLEKLRNDKKYQEKMKELKKRDPFVYKNF